MKNIQLMVMILVVLLTMTINAKAQTAQTKSSIPNQKAYIDNTEMSKVKAHIAELLKDNAFIYSVKYDEQSKRNIMGTSLGTPKNVIVLDDRIELSFKHQNTVMYFKDLLDSTITASSYGYIPLGGYSFKMGKKADELANALIFIQQHLHIQTTEQRYDSLLTVFKPVAANYHELKLKPPVSEEQRKLIVQANLFNQQKNYSKAIELYNKAVELDQTAYPAAYYNLALLSAQLQKFNTAIYYMKKYLLLEPEATDARGAQDKIYEWEAMTKK